MDLNGTTLQVQGVRFRFCKFVDLSGTSGQVRGPLVYLTLYLKKNHSFTISSVHQMDLRQTVELLCSHLKANQFLPERNKGYSLTDLNGCISSLS